MKLEWLAGVAMAVAIPMAEAAEPAMTAGVPAEAVPPAEETGAGVVPPPALPRRALAADPWFTRASVSAVGGLTNVSATIPVAVLENDYASEAQTAGLAIDLYGRRLGFHLALVGSATENVNAPIAEATGSRLTHAAGELSLGATLWSSHGVFVSAGPAIEGRATAVGHFEEGNEAVASWQTVVAGGDIRTRLFAGPHVYVTSSLFVGAVPVSGGWQSVDAATATTSDEIVGSADLAESLVISGDVAAAVRPAEWMALSAGVSVRSARYSFDDNSTGTEKSVRPYLALQLLY